MTTTIVDKYRRVIEAASRFALTAPVDDDFPQIKHELDRAMASLVTDSLNFAALRETNSLRAKEWGGADTTSRKGFLIELLFRSNELGGESGETQDAVKKLARRYLDMPGSTEKNEARNNIADEIADTIICCDRLAELLNIDLAEAIKEKFNKTSDKHGFKTKF